jgi:putative pyruvate formate lyase activating enzyme
LVYNTSAYDGIETLKLLDGVVDIYMPDFKFLNALATERYCAAKDYPETAQKSILEMYRQLGDLQINADGIAYKGLLIRHLIMPNGLSDTHKILAFIARKISTNTYVNIMSQYRPCGSAKHTDDLTTTIGVKEYRNALCIARNLGFVRLDGHGPFP